MVTDAKDAKRDVVPAKGGDSEDKSQKDSAQPKVYTEDEAEKKFSSQRSVLDKKVTGLEKSLEVATKKATDAEARESDRLAVSDAAELEAAKDDPAETTIIQRRQKVRAREIAAGAKEKEIEAKEAASQSAIDAATATQFEVKVFEIATEEGIDASKLKELAKDFNITDPEQLVKLAKATSKKEGTGPDSGKTMGGGQQLTEQERLYRRYPSMKK